MGLSSSQVTKLNRMNRAAQDVSLGTLLENEHPESYQLLVADGAITVKNGICKIAKTVAGVVASTLANPTDVTDDFKVLTIISDQAQLNTVTCTGGFGGGGTGEDVITFSGAIGDTVELKAHGGFWYIVGGHQFSVA